MFRRIGSLITKELIQLRRDVLFLLLITLGPVSELTAVAYATGAEIKNLPIAIYDYDHSEQSRALIRSVANIETFAVVTASNSMDGVIESLDRSQVYGVLIIPPNFEDDLNDPTTRPQVQVLLNGAESQAAERAKAVLEGAIARYGTDLVMDATGLDGSEFANMEPSARVWYNEELREANYTIPSELGFMLYVVALWVAAVGIARERELGTLEQLMVTPIKRFELLIGKMAPAVLIAYVNFLLMLAMAIFIFKVPMRGSLPLLLILAMVYILVELQRGLLISVLVKTQQQGLLAVFTMAFVDMTFAGYAVPVESMPQILQTVANIFPIRHWMIIMRGIMLKGVGLEVFWPRLLAILGLGLVLMLIALTLFQQALSGD